MPAPSSAPAYDDSMSIPRAPVIGQTITVTAIVRDRSHDDYTGVMRAYLPNEGKYFVGKMAFRQLSPVEPAHIPYALRHFHSRASVFYDINCREGNVRGYTRTPLVATHERLAFVAPLPAVAGSVVEVPQNSFINRVRKMGKDPNFPNWVEAKTGALLDDGRLMDYAYWKNVRMEVTLLRLPD